LELRLTGTQAAAILAKSNGTDLRVVASDGSVFPYELVRWESNAIELYVKVLKIAAKAAGQYLDLYYGNPNAVPAPQASAWDEHYRFVLHMAGNLNEAAGKRNVATAEGPIEIKETARLDAERAFLNINPELLHGLGQQITIAVRFRVHDGPPLQTLASGRRTDAREEWFNFGIKTPNIVHTNATSNGQRAPELNPHGIAPDEWHAAIVVYDAQNHTRTICIDGMVLERDSALPGPLEIQEMRIGRGLLHFDPWQFHGELDEVRLSDVARSDSWIRAEAACLGDRNTFIAIGPPQEYGKPAPPPAPFDLLLPPDGAQSRQRVGAAVQWRPSAGASTILAACPKTVPSSSSTLTWCTTKSSV
jgi:hypothetical protein